MERGEYSQAIAAYSEAADAGDVDSDLLARWANALIATGQLGQALEKIEAALDEDDANGDAYLIGAHVLDMQQRSDDALALFEAAATIVKDDPRLYTRWGQILADQDMPDQARLRYRQAIDIAADFAPAYLGLGELFEAREQFREAEAQFRLVIDKIDPDSAAAFAGWARVLLELGEFGKAAERFERTIELVGDSPELIRLRLAAGHAHYEYGAPEKALATFDRAVGDEKRYAADLQQRYELRHRGAQAALEADLPDRALAHCEDGIALLERHDADDSQAAAALHYAAGVAEVALKLYDDATDRFKRASEISPTFAVHSMIAIASTLTAQGRYEEAWGHLRTLDAAAERIKSAGHGDDREQLYSLGTALMWLERLDDAESVFKRALGPDKRNTDAWIKLAALNLERREQSVEQASHHRWQAQRAYRRAVTSLEGQMQDGRTVKPVLTLGLLHLRMGDLDEAEKQLEQAAGANGSRTQALAGLGLTAMQRGEHGKAVELLEKALSRDPDNLVIQCHLADAYSRLGRTDTALETYEEVLRTAPCNVGALVDAAEIQVGKAEESNDDRLYERAEQRFSTAIELARSIRRGSRDRKGSDGLGVRRWADLYYSRGYVRVKLYEAKMDSGIERLAPAGRQHLLGALNDFETSKRTKVNPYRAERAADRVREGLRRFSPEVLSEKYASGVVVALAFALLVVAQVDFFSGGESSRHLDPVAYATLTLSLLTLMAAGFYLPQILKLRFGGIELEKGTGEQSGSFALDVNREPIQASLHQKPEPPMVGDPGLGQEGRGGGRQMAARGPDVGKRAPSSEDVRQGAFESSEDP